MSTTEGLGFCVSLHLSYLSMLYLSSGCEPCECCLSPSVFCDPSCLLLPATKPLYGQTHRLQLLKGTNCMWWQPLS